MMGCGIPASIGSMCSPVTPPSRRTRSTISTLYAYSASPAMAANMDNVGAKYPTAFFDADGDHLQGSKNYKLHIPKDVPVALFWSVTVYDPITGSGLDNGQPFPSINRQARTERRRLAGHLLRPEVTRSRQELARDNPRQGVLRDLPPLWPQAGVLRPDLEARRYRKDQLSGGGAQ